MLKKQKLADDCIVELIMEEYELSRELAVKYVCDSALESTQAGNCSGSLPQT